MPQPGEDSPKYSTEDSFLDLLAETLEGLDDSARGPFLRQFFRTIAQVTLTDAQSNEYWERILAKRRDLAERLGKRVSLKTAIVDVLASTSFLRVPVMMEYEDYKKLQINAATDALTGLYNRRLFDEYSDKELNRARRYGQSLAIVILDLHKLKEVNDRFGHLQGDLILQIAASTLRRTLRASDFAFRIGGDEFALLLPQTDPEQAVTLCRRVRTQYETELRPLNLEIGVTIDFGAAVYPLDGEVKTDLMRLADQRLYELKRSGRPASRVIPMEGQPPRPAAGPAEMSPAEAETSRESTMPSPPVDREAFPRPKESGIPHPAPPAAASVPSPVTPEKISEKRNWERVSLAGTKAYAVLTDSGQKTAAVIDLSYGGVALLIDKIDEVPSAFKAVLHVPILPPVRVSLKRAYTKRLESGRIRVGCSFVS
jgi:diguanylate cyclase (GGDEF)-like protein